MTAKEYLQQARYLDSRINSKIKQLNSLKDLATKCTSTISDMPRNPNKGNSGLEDTVIKIVSLEEEINNDIDNLVDLKKEIMQVIKKISNPEYKTILEERYLSFETWEDIAVDFHLSVQQIFRLHAAALKEVKNILKDESYVIE
ncbi:MAG: DUF1492 domain-containing protein [Oscillospiraceae bacterium]